MSDAIDRYLDELAVRLRGEGATIRRILAETEDHLREAVATLAVEGRSDGEAARLAIEQFGSPPQVAEAFASQRPLRDLLPPVLRATTVLGGVGLTAIGMSGLLAQAAGAVFGQAFVAGDLPGTTYTTARCAEYLALFPKAGSCTMAAVTDHFGEVVQFRVAAGVLGLLVLLLVRWRRRPSQEGLPDVLVPAIGCTLFAVAAIGLIGQALLQALGWGTTSGMGAYLADGSVAALVAAGFGRRTLRVLRSPVVSRS